MGTLNNIFEPVEIDSDPLVLEANTKAIYKSAMEFTISTRSSFRTNSGGLIKSDNFDSETSKLNTLYNRFLSSLD